MSNSLFRISVEQMRIDDQLMETGGELTPELEEALAINTENFQLKASSYATSIHKFDSLIEAADAEIKRINAIKKSAQGAKQRLKDTLAFAMDAFGYDKYDLGLHKLSFRNSTAVNITDETHIPAEYIIVETKVDKAKIKDALKGGAMIAGAKLVNNKSLQIR